MLRGVGGFRLVGRLGVALVVLSLSTSAVVATPASAYPQPGFGPARVGCLPRNFVLFVLDNTKGNWGDHPQAQPQALDAAAIISANYISHNGASNLPTAHSFNAGAIPVWVDWSVAPNEPNGGPMRPLGITHCNQTTGVLSGITLNAGLMINAPGQWRHILGHEFLHAHGLVHTTPNEILHGKSNLMRTCAGGALAENPRGSPGDYAQAQYRIWGGKTNPDPGFTL